MYRRILAIHIAACMQRPIPYCLVPIFIFNFFNFLRFIFIFDCIFIPYYFYCYLFQFILFIVFIFILLFCTSGVSLSQKYPLSITSNLFLFQNMGVYSSPPSASLPLPKNWYSTIQKKKKKPNKQKIKINETNNNK